MTKVERRRRLTRKIPLLLLTTRFRLIKLSATSVEPPATPLTYSDATKKGTQAGNEQHNYFDDLASDSDDDGGYFVRDVDESKTNTSSNN